MGENEDDFHLLHSDPHALVLKLQNLFMAVAQVYRRDGPLRDVELGELTQEMSLQFLRNIETIRRNYSPSGADAASLRAYVRSLARNVCRKFFREGTRYLTLSPADPRTAVNGDSVTDPLAIAQTVEVFRAALDTLGNRRAKLLLFLKLYYRTPVREQDLLEAYPKGERSTMQELLLVFAGDFSHMAEGEVFESARPFLNRLDGSTTTAESYARWTTREVGDLCEVLNGDPPVSAFDKHSLHVLVEDYFHPFLLRQHELPL